MEVFACTASQIHWQVYRMQSGLPQPCLTWTDCAVELLLLLSVLLVDGDYIEKDVSCDG